MNLIKVWVGGNWPGLIWYLFDLFTNQNQSSSSFGSAGRSQLTFPALRHSVFSYFKLNALCLDFQLWIFFVMNHPWWFTAILEFDLSRFLSSLHPGEGNLIVKITLMQRHADGIPHVCVHTNTHAEAIKVKLNVQFFFCLQKFEFYATIQLIYKHHNYRIQFVYLHKNW